MRTRTRALVRAGGARVAALTEQQPIPRAVVLGAVPRALARRFDPVSAGDLEAVFELRVLRGESVDRFALRISGARLTTVAGAAAGAGAWAAISAQDMIRLVSGTAGWPGLLAAGRLTMGGDPFLALRFPSLFRLPARARPA